MQYSCKIDNLTGGVDGLIPARVVMNDCSKLGGWRFDPHQERLRALQLILNGGNPCFVNCDANILSYYYGGD